MASSPDHLPESTITDRFSRPFRRYDLGEIYVKYAHTTSQLEIFQFVIDKFDETERRGEVYGKIEVIDVMDCLTLYHRDRVNSEHIHANSNLSLMGFPRSLCNLVGFGVSIDLRLRGEDGDEFDDVVLGKWQVSWDNEEPEIVRIAVGGFSQDFRDQKFDVKHQVAGFDRPLCINLEGPNGCHISMYYGLFQHAVQAWIQAEVVDMNDPLVNVEFDARGSITTSYSQFEFGNDADFRDRCKTTLLETKDKQSLKIKNGKKIQLSRSVIAVPIYTSLVIEVELWSTNHFKIAKGKVEFLPKQCDYGYDYIKGDGDVAIRVMVAWLYGSGTPEYNPF